MVVHYPRTVWKNSYAEHEVTSKTYNLKNLCTYVGDELPRGVRGEFNDPQDLFTVRVHRTSRHRLQPHIGQVLNLLCKKNRAVLFYAICDIL